jgi:hypothetical protein
MTMNAKKLPNGSLLVPARAEDRASGVVGDGMIEAKPGTKLYNDWLPFTDGGKPRATRKAAPTNKTKPTGKK